MPTKMKVCNTKDYNRSLKKRGSFFSLFNEAIKVWLHNDVNQVDKSKLIYSREMMQILAVVRYTLNFPYRQLEGALEEWVSDIKALELPIPNFSTLCRRIGTEIHSIRDHRSEQEKASGGKIEIMLDSTGINIYATGGGHSKKNAKSRKHNHYEQIRKLHIAIDADSGDVLSMKMTDGITHDSEVAVELINAIDEDVSSIYADRAYDTKAIRKVSVEKGAKQKIPPKSNSVIRNASKSDPPNIWDDRNEAITFIKGSDDYETGFKEWKKHSGYSKRSKVEAYFSRFKRIFGFHFMSRCEISREIELMTKALILNGYNKLGKAEFERVA